MSSAGVAAPSVPPGADAIGPPDPGLVGDVRRRLVAARAAGPGGSALLGLSAGLADELLGLGPLAPLVADPAVTDVLVNGPGEIWCDTGDGLRRAAVRFADEAAVRRLAQRLAAQAGHRLDDGQPYVDADLPDGTRLHAVLPPVASGSTLLSLRVPRRGGYTLDGLAAVGALPEGSAALLRAVVRARLPFLVTGGTGTGKTTLLSALLGQADPAERVVLVEETPELRPDLPHVVRLRARPANAEGAGAVPLAALVRQTLRMRPDRIVVGEVRGGEVVDLLQAFNSGHDGGAGTLHANGLAEVPARVEALALGAGLDRPAAHSLLAAAVRVVVHLRRGAGGARHVAEVGVTGRNPEGLVVVRPAWSVNGAAPDAAGALDGLLERRGTGWPR